MAIRLRKLAKTIRRTPDEVLVALRSIGIERYTSPNDMLSDRTATKVRTAMMKSGEGRSFSPRGKQIVIPQLPPKNDDVMSSMVPGIVKIPTLNKTSDGADLKRRIERLEQRREELQLEEQRLDVLRAELAQGEATRSEAEREIVSQKEILAEQVALNSCPSLKSMLRALGVEDEPSLQEALRQLAAQPWAQEALLTARVTNDQLVPLLAEKTVTFGGEVPNILPAGLVGLCVDPSAAQMPSAPDVQNAIEKLTDTLMLFGLSRVVIVGASPMARWFVLNQTEDRIIFYCVEQIEDYTPQSFKDVDLVLFWGHEASSESVEFVTTRNVPVGVLDGTRFDLVVEQLVTLLNSDKVKGI